MTISKNPCVESGMELLFSSPPALSWSGVKWVEPLLTFPETKTPGPGPTTADMQAILAKLKENIAKNPVKPNVFAVPVHQTYIFGDENYGSMTYDYKLTPPFVSAELVRSFVKSVYRNDDHFFKGERGIALAQTLELQCPVVVDWLVEGLADQWVTFRQHLKTVRHARMYGSGQYWDKSVIPSVIEIQEKMAEQLMHGVTDNISWDAEIKPHKVQPPPIIAADEPDVDDWDDYEDDDAEF